ncbi:cobalamin-dependent protein [Nocardioides perillae]|uniref:Methanogenic corrinoid protein MtbC1 n=1 Tax=Nocardioides perillae TaxID=1119534 RepID=A0A7Y9RSJ9_9ACTN|nr:methanogenic corrinoid protein MtbC1 [Nocardioides perillae]
MSTGSRTDDRTDHRREADDYWRAVVANDVDAALAVVDHAAEHDPDGALERLVAGTQVRVGELWERDEFTVAQEHAATAVSELVVRHHLERSQAARPRVDRAPAPVVVACAEREWHALPGLLIAASLSRRGLDVVSLGADVSAQRLHGALLDAPVTAVLVSASLSSSLPRVRAHVETARLVGTPVVVGGSAFDRAGRRAAVLGATAQAGDAATAADLVPSLPRRVSPAPPLTHPGVDEAVLLEADQARLVDSVQDRLLQRAAERTAAGPDAATEDRWSRVLGDQLPHLLGSVAAALLVEEPEVLGEVRRWLSTVLAGRSAPPTTVDDVWSVLREVLHDFPHATALLDRSGPA